ncbi:hypothetical protein EON65_29785 [archaeon]|nr:MAG: hypothetical protein EON65_29785 [archaeon]
MAATRWDLKAQWKTIVEENIHTPKHLIGDKLKHLINWLDRPVEALGPGEGGICSAGAKKVGAYRDKQGQLHCVKPVCTHLGNNLSANICIVYLP